MRLFRMGEPLAEAELTRVARPQTGSLATVAAGVFGALVVVWLALWAVSGVGGLRDPGEVSAAGDPAAVATAMTVVKSSTTTSEPPVTVSVTTDPEDKGNDETAVPNSSAGTADIPRPAGPPDRIRAVAAYASSERTDVADLRCGGENSFEAGLLIDGDDQTGWGVANGTGVGQWIVVDLGARYELTDIGLTPGYLRTAPRASNGCQDALAFFYNQFVEQVRYIFDDGTFVEQSFEPDPFLFAQTIEVDVITREIRIEIRSLVDWGEDDDVIISEFVAIGY